MRAGADWAGAGRSLTAQIQAHALLTHEEDGVQEKGFSGSLAWDPRPDSLRGAAFTLGISKGATAGEERLLAGEGFDLGSGAETGQNLEATLGYGVGAFGDRFTAVPQASLAWSGDAWDVGLGWRLAAEQFDLLLQANHRKESQGGAGDEIRLRVQGRW